MQTHPPVPVAHLQCLADLAMHAVHELARDLSLRRAAAPLASLTVPEDGRCSKTLLLWPPPQRLVDAGTPWGDWTGFGKHHGRDRPRGNGVTPKPQTPVHPAVPCGGLARAMGVARGAPKPRNSTHCVGGAVPLGIRMRKGRRIA